MWRQKPTKIASYEKMDRANPAWPDLFDVREDS